jgi:hypothetical protein
MRFNRAEQRFKFTRRSEASTKKWTAGLSAGQT